ncbi:DUF7344 domain-containing protein [Halomarina litorea]|uniref:DUF7344 domain-containing protein n=1 Tax=Halomarina litorea TaxID=2961595 RepID=UPI0020C33CDD|nr:hypothetical protein [Halomarina sp. BCD28]
MAIVQQEQTLDEGDIHDVLRNTRRRLTIDSLQASENGTMSVRDLSERVATEETGEDPPPRKKRQSVYVSLHQTHLPKLHKLGIVEYDDDSKVVYLQERVREVEVYMEVVPRYGISWGEYYIAFAFLGMLVVIAAELGIVGFALITPAQWAIIFFLGVVLSATYHVYTQQGGLPFSRLY